MLYALRIMYNWSRRLDMIVWKVGCVGSFLGSTYLWLFRYFSISIMPTSFFQKRKLNVAIMSIVLAQHLLVRSVAIFITRLLKQFSYLAMYTPKIALEREEKENLNRAKANSLTWECFWARNALLAVIRPTKKRELYAGVIITYTLRIYILVCKVDTIQ